MDPELKRLEKEFSLRLDRWMSKQGIIFQLKHSSGPGTIFSKLCSLLFRLAIVLLIIMAIFWFYLINRPNSESYKEDLALQIKAGTSASSVDVGSVARYKGGVLGAQLKIGNVTLGSSDSSFYEDWYTEEEVHDLNGNVHLENKRKQLEVQSAVVQPLGIVDNYLRGWSGKKITLENLHCHLKTGADTDQVAMASYLSIFKEYESFKLNNIVILDAHIGWGYGVSRGSIKGSIKGAEIEALKKNDLWEITVTGGIFSHGWLKNAQIIKMNIECHKDGLVKVVSADLRMGAGTISFDTEIQIKSKPMVKGKLSFEGIEVTDLIGEEYAAWLDGQVKGEVTLGGTLNSLSGISTKTTITLSAPANSNDETSKKRKITPDDSFLIIRGKFPILEAMQRINSVNSYNLLRLNIGKFVIEQTEGDTMIKDINVRSDDFLIIKGSMKYAWVSLKEKKEQKVDPNTKLKSSMDGKRVKETDLAGEKRAEDREVKIFSGALNLGFIPQVFEGYPEIMNVYPEDSNTVRVWIPVKMKGEIHEASSSIAEKLEKIVQEAREEKENN